MQGKLNLPLIEIGALKTICNALRTPTNDWVGILPIAIKETLTSAIGNLLARP